ncbi:MAG: arylesterase [Eubacterium sp.]|nr:arylesterase [Eubacterium sp.]
MKSLLVFGDSNTWGLIPGSSPCERYPDHIRWTGILQSRHKEVRLIEEGLCGRTTSLDDPTRKGRNGKKSLPLILESQSPIEAAIIMLGTNDCKGVYAQNPCAIGRGIEACLIELEKNICPEKILLISPIHLGEQVWRKDKDPDFTRESVEKCKLLKEIYAEIAKRRGNAFLDPSKEVQADFRDDEHMNEEGHRLFANLVDHKIKQINLV